MAYSNWGAFVYKNGERRTDKEDVGVFDTDEGSLPTEMRIFVNIYKNQSNKNDDWSNHSHHAVLGDDIVRFCGYKSNPELWAIINEKPERVLLPKIDYDCDDAWELHDQSGELEVDGKVWKWWFNQYNENMINLKLIEPNGDIWLSTCGYQYGAGFMNE